MNKKRLKYLICLVYIDPSLLYLKIKTQVLRAYYKIKIRLKQSELMPLKTGWNLHFRFILFCRELLLLHFSPRMREFNFAIPFLRIEIQWLPKKALLENHLGFIYIIIPGKRYVIWEKMLKKEVPICRTAPVSSFFGKVGT